MRSESLHQSLSLTSAMAEIGALIGQPAQALEGPLERAHIPSPPVRILFLNHTAEPGGAEIAMLNLVRHLDRRKIAPVVVFGTDGPVVEQMRRHAEVHVLSLPASVGGAKKDAMGAGSVLQFRAMLAAIAYIWRLARFIRQIRPDFIHTNSLKAHFLGGFAARLSATPVVWHVRNSVDSDYLPSSIVRVIFRGLAKLVPRFIIACSGATLRTVVPHGPETDGCEASGSKITDAVPWSTMGRPRRRSMWPTVDRTTELFASLSSAESLHGRARMSSFGRRLKCVNLFRERNFTLWGRPFSVRKTTNGRCGILREAMEYPISSRSRDFGATS